MDPQRRATRPGLVIRGTFSPARAWRHAAGVHLAQTLGRKERLLRCATTLNTNTTEITLRRAAAADALCLGVLATQVFLDTYALTGVTETVASEVRKAFSTEAFIKVLAASSTFITVAVQDSALVGFAQSTIGTAQSLAPNGMPAELDKLYVQKPFTNRGVGSRLLQSHEELAARHGVEVLWLSPWVGNHRALRFYAKHEYEDYGLVFFYMGPDNIENRVYAKRLPAIAA